MDNRKIAGSSDTGLLKIIAFITMTADHVGYLFFPEQIIWRIIGRISFPIFAYCAVLGYIHTRNLKKYFLRLLSFSIVSQIPYTFCFYPESIGLYPGSSLELDAAAAFSPADFQLNIGFTMMLGLWGIFGIDKRKYWHTALALLISFVPNVEYGAYGVIFMLVSYFFIFYEKAMFKSAAAISLASPLFKFFISGYIDIQFFAAFAVFPISAKTDSGIKIPRWLNYGFYPAHLCVLGALNFIIK
ncbi:MAG: hypothetical protein IJ945_01780 [Oscillospiraceae bacterium]|nr:hypothetical protein [Oscillospiraceae bacterium]